MTLTIKKKMVWKIGHGDLGTLRRKEKGDKVLVLFFQKKNIKWMTI